jgi:hypothetical protein
LTCHAVDVDGLGQRRTYLHLRYGQARARSGGLFQRPAKFVEAGDEAVHQIAGTGVGNFLHHGSDVHHRVAFEHAQTEIIEVEYFHIGSSLDLLHI